MAPLLTDNEPFIRLIAFGAVFLIMAVVTVVAAAATVTCRKPVYSARWFGLSLLGVVLGMTWIMRRDFIFALSGSLP